jgi:hypothetical protein
MLGRRMKFFSDFGQSTRHLRLLAVLSFGIAGAAWARKGGRYKRPAMPIKAASKRIARSTASRSL